MWLPGMRLTKCKGERREGMQHLHCRKANDNALEAPATDIDGRSYRYVPRLL